MAKVQINPHGVTLWVSAAQTAEWGRRWPLSRLRGHRLVAQFDARGNLVDYKVDGRGGADIPSDEFNALTSPRITAPISAVSASSTGADLSF